MTSSGFEIFNYHTSHVQWLPGKAMKKNCNILWGSFAAKRWCLAEQQCQTVTFSFLSWLFLYYCFFKHTMRTGTKDTGGSWQFEWITILQKCLRVLWRDFYLGTSISPNLWQSLACISLTQVLLQGRFFQKLSHLIFWVQILQNMNLDEKSCSSCIYP